jgi:hypothetical protein
MFQSCPLETFSKGQHELTVYLFFTYSVTLIEPKKTTAVAKIKMARSLAIRSPSTIIGPLVTFTLFNFFRLRIVGNRYFFLFTGTSWEYLLDGKNRCKNVSSHI